MIRLIFRGENILNFLASVIVSFSTSKRLLKYANEKERKLGVCLGFFCQKFAVQCTQRLSSLSLTKTLIKPRKQQ